jgi:hypothetical protein
MKLLSSPRLGIALKNDIPDVGRYDESRPIVLSKTVQHMPDVEKPPDMNGNPSGIICDSRSLPLEGDNRKVLLGKSLCRIRIAVHDDHDAAAVETRLIEGIDPKIYDFP